MLESPDELQSNEDDLRELLLEFFEQHIQERFPEADYTFDVYVTTAGKVRPVECLNLKPLLACDAHAEVFPAGWAPLALLCRLPGMLLLRVCHQAKID